MTDLSRAYLQGGVSIDPMPPEFKSRVNVSYAGKLATRADGQLYMMVGYGPVDKIFQQQDEHYNASFEVSASDTINLAFKDAGGNIDDNNQQYWRTRTDSENLSYA